MQNMRKNNDWNIVLCKPRKHLFSDDCKRTSPPEEQTQTGAPPQCNTAKGKAMLCRQCWCGLLQTIQCSSKSSLELCISKDKHPTHVILRNQHCRDTTESHQNSTTHATTARLGAHMMNIISAPQVRTEHAVPPVMSVSRAFTHGLHSARLGW